MRKLGRAFLAVFATWVALRAWAARHPTPFPYFGRALLDAPRPLLTRSGLLEVLAPAAGERMLELGPGSGYYTLPVAARLVPGGILEILDIQRRFLDHTLERARRQGIDNIVATLGDGRSLPYRDESFDAAYLMATLGEIADPAAALHELRRVLKPTGRLVVGEIFIDPDFPRLRWLVGCARDAGLRLERRRGSALGYFARFRRDEAGSGADS
jgi:SAM-dependent methyltransferase